MPYIYIYEYITSNVEPTGHDFLRAAQVMPCESSSQGVQKKDGVGSIPPNVNCWLVVWNISYFPLIILVIIIPTDEYFSEGSKPPTRLLAN